MRRVFRIFKSALLSFQEDKAPRLSAALSYYTVFSIPPFLVVMITIAGMVFGRDAVQGRVVSTLARLVGPEGALAIKDMLASSHQMRQGLIASGIGVATLLLGASGVFSQLKDALNTLWEVEPRPGRGIVSWLRQYVFSMMVLFGTAFLLVVSLSVSAALAALGDYLARVMPGGQVLWQGLNFGVSLAVIATLFALLFRFIPDATPDWKHALVGGGVTSVLFTGGETLIGLYLGRTNVGSAFGAAGSVVVMLVWVYYSSMIFFFGAEFTKAYAMHRGEPVKPDPHAVPVTREAREQQGIRWKHPEAAHGAAAHRAREALRDPRDRD